MLSRSGLTSPEVIRAGPLLEDACPLLFFGAAVTTAFARLWLLRRRAPRALLTGERVAWQPVAPERRHVAGSVAGILVFRRLQARARGAPRPGPVARLVPPPAAADATA